MRKDLLMLPDRLHAYETTPLHELLAVLLRQYRRPLTGRGVKLSDAEAAELAEAIVRGEAHPQADAVRAALVDLMAESEAVLARYGLTFPDSLAVTMESIGGWETTAEFLEVANEKANAELRLSTGAALLVALGGTADEARLRRWLAALAAQPDDLDGVIARRVLAELPSRS
jgi:hypothetical protein